jgi:hypothetical protein
MLAGQQHPAEHNAFIAGIWGTIRLLALPEHRTRMRTGRVGGDSGAITKLILGVLFRSHFELASTSQFPAGLLSVVCRTLAYWTHPAAFAINASRAGTESCGNGNWP